MITDHTKRGDASIYVCPLADCGPDCARGHIHVFRWITSLCGCCQDPRWNRRSDDDPWCCTGAVGDVCSNILTRARLVIVPLGLVFVALCPTNNYWTEELPGSAVVKDVHLSAAFTLFVGGTVTEALRLYFLWCESRDEGRRQYGEHHFSSCVRFLLEPPLTDRRGALATEDSHGNSKNVASEGIGPLRPWLMMCMCVGVIGAAWSCTKEIHMTESTLRVKRGDVSLSPVGTAFCPQPEFEHVLQPTFIPAA